MLKKDCKQGILPSQFWKTAHSGMFAGTHEAREKVLVDALVLQTPKVGFSRQCNGGHCDVLSLGSHLLKHKVTPPFHPFMPQVFYKGLLCARLQAKRLTASKTDSAPAVHGPAAGPFPRPPQLPLTKACERSSRTSSGGARGLQVAKSSSLHSKAGHLSSLPQFPYVEIQLASPSPSS